MATLTFRIPARLIRRAAPVNDNDSWRPRGSRIETLSENTSPDENAAASEILWSC